MSREARERAAVELKAKRHQSRTRSPSAEVTTRCYPRSARETSRFPQTPSTGPLRGQTPPASDQKDSPSRFRFRPPLLLTFRLGLAAFSYGPQVRFRPTRAPCSAQAAL